jgi:hypothetical protein
MVSPGWGPRTAPGGAGSPGHRGAEGGHQASLFFVGEAGLGRPLAEAGTPAQYLPKGHPHPPSPEQRALLGHEILLNGVIRESSQGRTLLIPGTRMGVRHLGLAVASSVCLVLWGVDSGQRGEEECSWLGGGCEPPAHHQRRSYLPSLPLRDLSVNHFPTF